MSLKDGLMEFGRGALGHQKIEIDGRSIDNIIQLQSGFRIMVNSIEKQPDGSYLGHGTSQTFGLFHYADEDPVQVMYDSNLVFVEYQSQGSTQNYNPLKRLAGWFREFFS